MSAEIFRQRKHQMRMTARNPQSHIAAKIAGTQCTIADAAFEVAGMTEAAGCVKGWLTVSSVKYNGDFACAGLRTHARRLPIATTQENGIRNLMDATIQSQ
jgi:hypothetical protein